jgi:hypothetical protein
MTVGINKISILLLDFLGLSLHQQNGSNKNSRK